MGGCVGCWGLGVVDCRQRGLTGVWMECISAQAPADWQCRTRLVKGAA